MERKREIILKTAEEIQKIYESEDLFLGKSGTCRCGMDVKRCLPDRDAIIEVIQELEQVVFPGYFGDDSMARVQPEYHVGFWLNHLYDKLKEQVEIALLYQGEEDTQKVSERSAQICEKFFRNLPKVQERLIKDVQAGFDGNPAAKSKEEIIFCYPGLFAIYVYRIAHELYVENVPYIPRIMTEYAHNKTGIDINPGATIGEYFFIDHGTGVVIGETTYIGDNVKLYQGVTLGALSTRSGQQLSGVKRHPTIENNVTIYSNSSVLGGETVIGENSTIGGNTFITESIPPNTRVSAKSPELVIKRPKELEKESIWDWEN